MQYVFMLFIIYFILKHIYENNNVGYNLGLVLEYNLVERIQSYWETEGIKRELYESCPDPIKSGEV